MSKRDSRIADLTGGERATTVRMLRDYWRRIMEVYDHSYSSEIPRRWWPALQLLDLMKDNLPFLIDFLGNGKLEEYEIGRSLTPRLLPEVRGLPERRGGIRMTLLKRSHQGEEDLFCPMVYCDACGSLIEGSGNVIYENSEDFTGPRTGELFFFHKGHDRAFEKLRGGHWMWVELQQFPLQLAANLSLDVKEHGDGYLVLRRKNQPELRPPWSDRQAKKQRPHEQPKKPPIPTRLDPRRSFSAMQKQEILLRSNGHCVSCGMALGLDWHADHIYPHSLGGVSEVINGQALCQPCNSRKHAKVLTVEES